MKATIHTFLISCALMLCSFSVNAQQIGLTLTAQGTQPYTAGNSFWVYANYNYSNVTGNIEISVSYDHTILTSCGSPDFPVLPTSSSSGSITTMNYIFPAVTGNNQTGVIMMCFYYVCPSTCFGTSLNTTLNSSIAAPGNSLSNTTSPLQISGQVNNNWLGGQFLYSYIQGSAELTVQVIVAGSSCHKIENPVFTINPSLGTLVRVTDASVSGNSFTPTNSTSFIPNHTYIYYYTIQLPCNLDSGTVVTSGIVLKGKNCGNSQVTILTLQTISYTIPAITPSNPLAILQSSAINGQYQVKVTNAGNTPLNLSIQNILPDVNTVNMEHTLYQGGSNTILDYEDCANTTTSHSFNQGTTVAAPSYVKKANIHITNLLPGFSSIFKINYNLNNSCSGVPTDTSFTLFSNVTYVCDTLSQSQVCISCGSGGNGSDTAIYYKSPKLVCTPPYIDPNPNCLSPGDTANLCIQIRNNGTAPLIGGVLNFVPDNFVSFVPGSESFTGFSANPTYQPGTTIKWDLPDLPNGGTYYKICFKVIVNSNAPYGSYVFPFSVSGANYEESFNCGHALKICALPQVEVEKLVRGDGDQVYGTIGNGTPGSYATYEVTVKNTGNTRIGNIILIDRLPFLGDKSIMSCTPRNSQFSLMPDAALSIPGATINYSAVPNAATAWPTADTLCNTPGTAFNSTFAPNNLEIHLSNTIPPGGTYVFTFTAKVPDNAVVGDKACNSIGLICDFFNNLNQGSQLNPVESNNICLEVKPAPVIPMNCCGDLTKEIETETEVSKGILKVNATLTAGPIKLQKVSVSLIDFRVMQANGCEACEKVPLNMGNFVNLSSELTWNFPIQQAEFGRLLEWSDPSGMDWSNGIPLDFSIPLPPHSAISCCCDTILYCLKYSFTDTNCVTCDTIICYKDIHGKECSPVVTPCCDLKWGAPDRNTYCIGDKVNLLFTGCVESGAVNIKLVDASNPGNVYLITSQYSFASGSYIWTIPQNFPCDTNRVWKLYIEEANRKCHAFGEKITITCCEPVGCKCPEKRWYKNANLAYTDGLGNEEKVKLACFSEKDPIEVGAGTNMTYSIGPYNCGTPECAAGYTWKIVDLGNNALVNSGSSASLPVSWTAPSQGKYQFFIYANCGNGDKSCDSCSFRFNTVPKEETCRCPEKKWGDNSVLTYTAGNGNNDKAELRCFSEKPMEVLAGTPMSYSKGPYDCGNPRCLAGYTWKIVDAGTNALVNSGTSAGLPISWTAPPEGKYQFFIYANCGNGAINCDSCFFTFRTLPKGGKCECGEWVGRRGFTIRGPSGDGNKIDTHLDCGKTYSSLYEGASPDLIAGNYVCKGKGECKVEYEWKITSPSGIVTTYHTQTVSGFVFNEVKVNNYTIELTLKCNGKICDTCISYVRVKIKPK